MSERPHYLWESPDGQTAVYLAFDAVDTINDAVAEAASLPVRGAEIGGLLIGKTNKRSQLTVWVDRVEFLHCRYERGPSFHLDEADRPDFSRPEIVGFFRTHTRKDLFLGPDDQSLIDHIGKPEQIALLVKPFQTRCNLGGFFVRNDGKMSGAASLKEFPFHRRELGGGESPARAMPPENLPKRGEREDFEAQAAAAEHRTRPTLLLAILALISLLATGSAAYLLFEQTKPIPPAARRPIPTVSPLRLSAFEGNHNVTLTWDKESPAVVAATRGLVEIQEGTFEKKLEVGAEELHNGKIVYSRPVVIADSVGFVLRVFPERGGPVAESLQVVSNQPLPIDRAPDAPAARKPTEKIPPPRRIP